MPANRLLQLQSHRHDSEQQEGHYLLFGLYKEQGQMDRARKELETFQRLKRRTADQEEKRIRPDSTDR